MAYSKNIKSDVKKARIDCGLTIAELHLKFNIPTSTIHTWIKDLPTLIITDSEISWKSYPWAEIKSYYENNTVTLKDCCEKYGITKHAIRQAVDHNLIEAKSHSRTMEILHKNGKHPGWTFNGRAERSIPEEFLYSKLVEYRYYDQYHIEEKFSFGRYWLDFAILDLKIDIEIDGQQHFNTQEAIDHDKKRDKYTKSKGWKVFRIAWKEFQAAPDEIMLMFGEFIEKNLPERSYSIDEIKKQYSTKSSKYGSRKAYFDHLREENLQKNQSKIELVKNSQISFSKLGWVTRVADLIKINPQKVRKWMKRYLPDVEKISYRRN